MAVMNIVRKAAEPIIVENPILNFEGLYVEQSLRDTTCTASIKFITNSGPQLPNTISVRLAIAGFHILSFFSLIFLVTGSCCFRISCLDVM